MRKVIFLFAMVFAALSLGAAPMSSHEATARELVKTVGGQKLAEASANAMLGSVLQNPDLAPYGDVLRAWCKKIFSEGDFEGELAGVYMKHFTEQELRELIAFYNTPVGQKALATMPEIMQEGAAIGARRAQEHQDELIQMIEKAKAEREKKDQ